MAYPRQTRAEWMARLLASTDLSIAKAARAVGCRIELHASQCSTQPTSLSDRVPPPTQRAACWLKTVVEGAGPRPTATPPPASTSPPAGSDASRSRPPPRSCGHRRRSACGSPQDPAARQPVRTGGLAQLAQRPADPGHGSASQHSVPVTESGWAPETVARRGVPPASL